MFHDVLMILLTRFRESRLLSGGGWHGLPQHRLQRQSSVCSHGPGSLCLSTGGASCAIKVKPPARVSVVPLVYHSGSCEYVWVLNGLTQFNILEHNICHIVLHYNIYIFIRFCLFAAPGGILPPGAGGWSAGSRGDLGAALPLSCFGTPSCREVGKPNTTFYII